MSCARHAFIFHQTMKCGRWGCRTLVLSWMLFSTPALVSDSDRCTQRRKQANSETSCSNFRFRNFTRVSYFLPLFCIVRWPCAFCGMAARNKIAKKHKKSRDRTKWKKKKNTALQCITYLSVSLKKLWLSSVENAFPLGNVAIVPCSQFSNSISRKKLECCTEKLSWRLFASDILLVFFLFLGHMTFVCAASYRNAYIRWCITHRNIAHVPCARHAVMCFVCKYAPKYDRRK